MGGLRSTTVPAPLTAWRTNDFVEDGTWSVGSLPLGYATAINDPNNYEGTLVTTVPATTTCVYLRRTFVLTNRLVYSALTVSGFAEKITMSASISRSVPRSCVSSSAATHGYLPLMVHEEARRAQLSIAVEDYKRHFGRPPKGIWLPECAYAPGVDRLLKENGILFTFLDAHGETVREPKTPEDWEMVRQAALTLTEAPNLLVMPGRRVAGEGQSLSDADAPDCVRACVLASAACARADSRPGASTNLSNAK